MEKMTEQDRNRNRRVQVPVIIDLIILHLGMNTIQDGDGKCKEVKQQALSELPHAIAAFAASGYAIYAQNSIVELYGMNDGLYKMLQRIAAWGDPGPDTIETFRKAMSYVLYMYCQAYLSINEEKRDEVFRKALEHLVAAYPLYLSPDTASPYPDDISEEAP